MDQTKKDSTLKIDTVVETTEGHAKCSDEDEDFDAITKHVDDIHSPHEPDDSQLMS
jgi:hypothetical protein